MTRALSTLLLFLFALCQCDAATKAKEDEAKENWKSLLAAVSAKDQVRANALVGKTVYAEGGRQSYKPPLRLTHKVADGRWLVIRLTPTFPSARAKREVGRILKYPAVFLEASVMGPLQSVDVDKAEILVEPVTAKPGAAT